MKTFKFAVLFTSIVAMCIAEAHAYGSFGGGRSFSSARSFSRPSYSRPMFRPSYTAPRPIVRNKTVVVQQHVTQHHSSGGMGFFGTLFATGAGSYIGNKLAQPSQPEPVAPPVQYPNCKDLVPGAKTPCIQ